MTPEQISSLKEGDIFTFRSDIPETLRFYSGTTYKINHIDGFRTEFECTLVENDFFHNLESYTKKLLKEHGYIFMTKICFLSETLPLINILLPDE